MTQKEAIAMAGAMRRHALSDEMLARFLTELEGRIATRIRRETVEPHISCPVRGCNTALSVPAPFDRIYWTYLVAMIDLAAGNGEQYRISRELFEEAFDAYARWYQQTSGNGA